MGHVVLAEGGGQLLGCMVTKPRNATDERIFPIIAAAVPSDLRRLHVGRSMLEHLGKVHLLDPSRIFQLKCRADLPANLFWAAAGMLPVAVQMSASVRGKPLIVWRRRVDGVTDGLDDLRPDKRPRAAGGRYLPDGRPDLAVIIDTRPEFIQQTLRESGARPRVGGWESVNWDGERAPYVPPLDRPQRPGDLQLSLFPDTPRFPAGRSSLLNGR